MSFSTVVSTLRRLRMPVLLLLFAGTSGGCALVRTIAGANIDPEQFAAAREAVMMDVRARGAETLARRLSRPPAPEEAELLVTISEAGVRKAVRGLVGIPGWIDPQTSYVIDSIDVRIHNGSGLLTMFLRAHSHAHDVDVDLAMDCTLTLVVKDGELVAAYEPFNISPVVKAGGMLSAAEDVIRDVIRVKLARMSTDIPPVKLPVDFANQMSLDATTVQVRSKVNLDIASPRRVINYGVKVREVLMFDRRVLVALDMTKTEVK